MAIVSKLVFLLVLQMDVLQFGQIKLFKTRGTSVIQGRGRTPYLLKIPNCQPHHLHPLPHQLRHARP